MTVAAQAEAVKVRAMHAADLEQLQEKLAANEREKVELSEKLRGSSIHHK